MWAIGYRGLNDYPFWNDEPSFNTTEKRCELINGAMDFQAQLVRNTSGRASDKFVTYFYGEMLDLLKSGHLVIPSNTTRIFADSMGNGSFDFGVHELLREGDGVYYHVQSESPGLLSQLTESVPPNVFFREIAPFVSKGAITH